MFFDAIKLKDRSKIFINGLNVPVQMLQKFNGKVEGWHLIFLALLNDIRGGPAREYENISIEWIKTVARLHFLNSKSLFHFCFIFILFVNANLFLLCYRRYHIIQMKLMDYNVICKCLRRK